MNPNSCASYFFSLPTNLRSPFYIKIIKRHYSLNIQTTFLAYSCKYLITLQRNRLEVTYIVIILLSMITS